MESSRIWYAAALALAGLAARLPAQQPDIIRGQVRAQDGRTIENARVLITTIPNNVTKKTETDKSGRYAVTFAGGDGDYWVTVSAIGFAPRRFELKRLADEAVLVGDVKLSPAGVMLEGVRVQADRARPGRNSSSTDISGTEKTVGSATVDPSQAGNLADMAASTPGVQLIPGADGNPDQYSVFGLGGDQNNTSMNGLGFSGTDIPRDATTRATLGTTPWDVSRGGFSGAQMGLSSQSGSNFSTRGLSTLLNSPSAQWTDRAGRSLGAPYASASIGAATAGPVVSDKSFYSAAYQFDRRTSDLPTLATADQYALRIAGVAPDSVARLRSILTGIGAPLAVSGLPTTKVAERGLLLANFDWAPPTSTSGQAITVMAASSFTRLNAPFAQVTALPTNDLRTSNWFGALQARQTAYLGGILTETSAGINQQRGSTTPYLAMPAGGVRVISTLDDGSAAIAGLTFGGSQMQKTSSTNTSAALQNKLSWFSLDNRHRVQLTTTVRYENFRQNLTTNQFGNFIYNSLADLEAGHAAVFTRTLAPRVQDGGQLVGSIALGDAFRLAPDFQLQYGVRADGNRFLRSPALNAAVRDSFGVANTAAPNRVYLSPRIGFSWTYGQSSQLAVGEGFIRGPRAVLRGGVGVFQNTPGAQIIGSALSNTGLPSAVSQLTCVGDAAPEADWNAFRNDASAIPTRCADGSTGSVFSNSAPEVWFFDPRFSAQRSARTNLNWNGAVIGNRFLAGVDATYSLNMNQPGISNLNFDPTVRFRLADEDGRAVFVRPSSIVPGTGSVAAVDARLYRTFGGVLEQRSDLRSIGRQFTVSLQPLVFSSAFSWNISYVYSNVRDVVRGFASTTSDPREREWARSSFDSRHQIVYGLSYNFFDWVPVGLSGSFRSGRPFTPMIGADVNGDGFRNDRAFVFDPALVAVQDAALAQGMRALLDRGSASARACLASQLGRLAKRNTCQEPWSSTSNLIIGVNPVKFRLPQRLNFSLYVNNALGAADVLLHGEESRRGWGQAINPDATLLYVRGFDAANQRFQYEVNPRFGATNPRATINRNPVVVTAQFRFDVGYTRERQLLTQSLDRGRRRVGARSTEQDIRGMSSTLIPQNPMALIMREADSLRLTRRQADSISMLNRVYAIAYDSIWTPVAKYLVALPADYDRAAAYERYRRARAATVDVLLKLVPSVRGLLTPEQFRRLPPTATTSLDRRYLASVRSSTAGGANMGALGLLAQMGWTGGTIDPSASAVMIHR